MEPIFHVFIRNITGYNSMYHDSRSETWKTSTYITQVNEYKVFYPNTITASISTPAPFGNSATPTAARAG